jgi:phage shock protein PspC (stress-responsive transcriptional regulator)
MQGWHRGPFWRRHQGSGGPLRRDPADRLLGGVASGVAAWRGFNPTAVRIVFVLIALVTTGFGVVGYVVAWLLIPAAGADRSIASKARTDARGIALALGLGTLLTLILLVGGVFNDSWFASWAWPQVASVAGLVLIWRNGSADEHATLRHYAEPLGAAVGETSRNRRSAIRLSIAALLVLT